MVVRTFRSDYAVEIRFPKFGSGYRIGGRLVLTAKHLFPGLGGCKVRLKDIFGEVDAEVVWISSDEDVALVELPETVEACEPVQLGRLPVANAGETVDFRFYGWPKWAFTEDPNEGPSAGGRQINGKIYLADTSPDGLLVLAPERCPKAVSEKQDSLWKGASGAAVVSAGCVVAVQSQHQNPAEPEALEAALLSKIYADSNWCQLLTKHGISPELQSVELSAKLTGQNLSVSPVGSEGRPSVEQKMAAALQRLDYSGQQEVFDEFLDSDRAIEAFVVEVTYDIEAELQKCLVSRLSRSLIGGKSPAFQTLGVDRGWRNNPTSELASRLAPALGLAGTVGIGEIHEGLLRLCRTQSVVIVLYGVPAMGNASLSRLMDEFWYPLVAKVEDLQGQASEGRLLLFLAGDRPMELLREQSNTHPTLDYPEVLENITMLDLTNWRKIPEVRQLMNCRCGSVPDLTSKLKQIAPQENAYAAMENVCGIFGFTGGLEQFEPFWKLSGDLVA